MKDYDLIVIGGGPGGYTAAIRAAQLGLSVALAEQAEIGGTCLNSGCIPTKTLLHSAMSYKEAQCLDVLGVHAEGVSFDMEAVAGRKVQVQERLRSGVESLLAANGVEVIRGSAVVECPGVVRVSGQKLAGANILIATGGTPVKPSIKGATLPGVLTSDELLANTKKLDRLVIIGGGVIGVEFASIYNALGTDVTIIEQDTAILPRMEKEVSQNLSMILKKRGVTVHTGVTVSEIAEGESLLCRFEKNGEELSVSGDCVLMSVGRVPNTRSLFGEGAPIATQRGFVQVDDSFQTSVKGIWAVGDVTGGALAHQAAAQGRTVAEKIAGVAATADLDVVPSCVYTSPEIAQAGITQQQAKAMGVPVKVGKYITTAMGKSVIEEQERGFIKLVFHSETERLLGAQLMCSRATDIVGELAAAISHGHTRQQLAAVMHPHPSYSEGIAEAAMDAVGQAIHAAPKKR